MRERRTPLVFRDRPGEFARRNTGWVAQQGGVAQASPRVASSAGASDQSLGGTVDRRGRLGEGVVLEVPENEHIDGGQLGCLLGEGKMRQHQDFLESREALESGG